jgi:hypothetical protein
MTSLTAAERLKFGLLADGLEVTEEALGYIASHNGDRPLTPADYASTSGIIIVLEGDVWVNAPIAAYNANFVVAPPYRLVCDGGGLAVEGRGLSASASFWLPPRFHGHLNTVGEEYNSYAFTHADRVRISPIEGCAFTCTFCDLPYEFRYRRKAVEGLVDVVRVALVDAVQPAHHILISGGTPRPTDYPYVREVYEAIITGFRDTPVDIMMVPIEEVMDLPWLASLGVAEISVNLELWGERAARLRMPRKHKQGRDHYLGYLSRAAAELGGGRVRSMLMAGLEPLADTLAGVEAIAERGCVPVLSPFRPDPSTPLRSHPVPTASFLEDAYLGAREITQRLGVALGPTCIPCAHNTLTLPDSHGNGDATLAYGLPHVV